MWFGFAVGSAFFAGITSILAKCGIKRTDSDVATAIRTIVVLIFAWIMVVVTGMGSAITSISARTMTFLILSGIATGASWLCYFKALQLGDVNKVVPIDKSSTVISVMLAILLLGETDNLAVKLIATALISVGIFLMVEKKASEQKQEKRQWVIYATLSAVFAALTSVLAKIGIDGVESNLATAVRTCVVLVMAWLIVLIKGNRNQVKNIDKKELAFIIISGVLTGASWLFYYSAIKHGKVSVVVPIDKLSIIVSIAFSYIAFKEKLSKKAFIGLALMVSGTLIMAIFT